LVRLLPVIGALGFAALGAVGCDRADSPPNTAYINNGVDATPAQPAMPASAEPAAPSVVVGGNAAPPKEGAHSSEPNNPQPAGSTAPQPAAGGAK
jgi:hypothetical protein